MLILERIRAGHVTWVSSHVLTEECRRNRDPVARENSESLLELVDVMMDIETDIGSHDQTEAKKIQRSAGVGLVDALHLVAAEKGHCEALLTTDDDFIKRLLDWVASGVSK